MTDGAILVPVTQSRTLRETVAYAVEQALDHVEETGEEASIRFVYPLARHVLVETEADETETARELLERVEVWVEEDLDGESAADSVHTETELIATHEFLFGPRDYADALVEDAEEHGLKLAVFDPGFNPVGTTPLLPPLRAEMQRAGLEVREAPVERPRRRSVLVRRATLGQFFALFGVSYLFYLLLAGSLKPFELATGAITAGVVAVALWRVSLTSPANPLRVARQLARFSLYVPFLLWEIAKANLMIAYVVLHPDLPIDPEVVEFDAAVSSTLAVATLANSITLTPGTLTVGVSRGRFSVHTLTKDARGDLLSGGLERAVRFVFYGRAAARASGEIERRVRDQREQDQREQDEEEA